MEPPSIKGVVRRFSPEYLRDSRRGLWDERQALEPLELPTRDRILDVGCGTGELTHVLTEESTASVTATDADRMVLERVETGGLVQGGATDLPFIQGSFDLVTCQALLINLAAPRVAIREFARISSDLVAAIEPDNAAVTIDSTVTGETELAQRARNAYMTGIGTDVSLGPDVDDRFRAAGLSNVASRVHNHRRLVEPPYSTRDLERAVRKASGDGLSEHRPTMLNGNLTPEGFDELRSDWRAMGRRVVEQMEEGAYRREETVPFYITIGQVL